MKRISILILSTLLFTLSAFAAEPTRGREDQGGEAEGRANQGTHFTIGTLKGRSK